VGGHSLSNSEQFSGLVKRAGGKKKLEAWGVIEVPSFLV